jgi:hypothetical protein
METVQTSVSRDTMAKERIYRPGSSSTKEGLAARAEKLERTEAEEEGLEGMRGIESESEVECIQVRRSPFPDALSLSPSPPTLASFVPVPSLLGAFVFKLCHPATPATWPFLSL